MIYVSQMTSAKHSNKQLQVKSKLFSCFIVKIKKMGQMWLREKCCGVFFLKFLAFLLWYLVLLLKSNLSLSFPVSLS